MGHVRPLVDHDGGPRGGRRRGRDDRALDPEKECESVPAPGEGCLSDCGMVSFEATVAGTVEDFDVNEWKRNIVRNTGVDCTPTSGCDLQVVVEPASVVVTTTFEFDE